MRPKAGKGHINSNAKQGHQHHSHSRHCELQLLLDRSPPSSSSSVMNVNVIRYPFLNFSDLLISSSCSSFIFIIHWTQHGRRMSQFAQHHFDGTASATCFRSRTCQQLPKESEGMVKSATLFCRHPSLESGGALRKGARSCSC